MADLKKFLDQAGVSTLWTRVAEEVAKVDAKAAKNAEDILSQGNRLTIAEGKIDALENGTYDDTEVRGLIADNVEAIGANAAAIATLNGEANVTGSVKHTATAIAAAKVAEIVAGADADFDTLKEIADWILNDTTGAADMANDIKALQDMMVGVDTTVVAEIVDAIDMALKVEGVDKYALATDLTALSGRVQTLENANYQNANQVGAAIDAKITALNLANTYDAKGAAHTAEVNAKAYADGLASNYEVSGAANQALVDAKAYADGLAGNYDVAGAAATAETNAKAHADGLNSAMDARVKILEKIDHSKFETAGAAANALTDAKSYTDTEFAKIQALTTAEIEAAIAAAVASQA